MQCSVVQCSVVLCCVVCVSVTILFFKNLGVKDASTPIALQSFSLRDPVSSLAQSAALSDHRIRATALLMGCSSGLLKDMGEYDPAGTALKLLLAGAPGIFHALFIFNLQTLQTVCH